MNECLEIKRGLFDASLHLSLTESLFLVIKRRGWTARSAEQDPPPIAVLQRHVLNVFPAKAFLLLDNGGTSLSAPGRAEGIQQQEAQN
jgi:hypothetical protein